MPAATGNSPKSTPLARTSKSPKEQNKSRNSTGRYEFSAPQFYDFNGPSPGVNHSETWFDKDHSPLHSDAAGATPNRISGLMADVPATVTQNRRRLTDESNVQQTSSTRSRRTSRRLSEKKIIVETSMQSPMVVAANKRSSNVFEELAPQQGHSYERLFEMTTRQPKTSGGRSADHNEPDEKPTVVAVSAMCPTNAMVKPSTVKSHSSQLGKVRTPDKVKLARLKTAAPLLPTRSTKPLTIPVEFTFSERSRPINRAIDVGPEIKTTWGKKPVASESAKRLTVPGSPSLSTGRRVKAQTIQSRMRTTDLAANSGLDIERKPRVTTSNEIPLVTGSRLNRERAVVEAVRSTSIFKTTPLPEGVDRLDTKPKLTVPVSPKLSTSLRIKSTSCTSINPPEPPLFKARPAPRPKPFVPRIEHHTVKPLDVHLPGEAIAAEKRKKFEEAIKRERQQAEEARKFYAKPMPKYDPAHNAGVPAPKTRPLTKPEPFNLISDLRYEQHHAELERRIRQEEAELDEIRQFHSRPMPHSAPFLPRKSTKPLTQVEDFELHSAERADRRREWEEALRVKEAELAELQRQHQELRQAREAEELRQLRLQLVPKAQPVAHYAPVKVKPSNRPLTIPHSPALQTSHRSRKRTDQ